MRKWMVLLILALATVGLAACGSGDATTDEIYTNALEAAEDMNSAEVEIEMKQEMEIPGESDPITMESKMAGSVIAEPLAMHQKGTTSIGMAEMSDEPMEMEQELYLVDNEFYSFESMTGQWIKMDESTMPMELLNSEQMDSKEQLSMLEDYVDSLEMEENEESYIFTFSPDGEEVKTLAEDLLEEVMPEEITSQLGEEVSELLKNTEIKNLLVEMTINKDSYQVEQYDMDMEMNMTLEGEEMNMKQKVKTIYKNINTVESIEVPQDVKDSAVEAPGF